MSEAKTEATEARAEASAAKVAAAEAQTEASAKAGASEVMTTATSEAKIAEAAEAKVAKAARATTPESESPMSTAQPTSEEGAAQPTSEERIARFAEEKKQAIAAQASAKHRHYALLLISICFEISATISLKASEGFTVLLPSIITVICYATSFGMLVVILKHLPLGLVYGVWGGLGTVATMLAGVLIWGDPFTPLMGVALLLIISGVYLLNKGTDELEAKRAQQN